MPSGPLSRLVAEAQTSIPERPRAPLALGISDCLLGHEVRYDGSAAKSSFPHAELEGLFTFRGICPEVGSGMSVPRPAIRLVDRGGIRAVGVARSDNDFTEALAEFARKTAPDLNDLAGYVLMKNSPSCGLFRVKVYQEKDGEVSGPPERTGVGIFARTLSEAMPDLPLEETGRLNDDVLRENFVVRTFAYAHWQALRRSGLTPSRLIEFHSRYKYLLMAHSVPDYQAAGRLLSDLKSDLESLAARYIAVLMRGLSRPASLGGHANVLAHLQGYLKRVLDSPSRQELAALIDAYRRGEQPLLAPLALLKHHLRRYPDTYLRYQIYLDPHPPAAALRRGL